jgi:hypothetical protein
VRGLGDEGCGAHPPAGKCEPPFDRHADNEPIVERRQQAQRQRALCGIDPLDPSVAKAEELPDQRVEAFV